MHQQQGGKNAVTPQSGAADSNASGPPIPPPSAILLDLGGTLARLKAFDIPAGQQRLYELAHNPRRIPFDLLRFTADPLAHSLFGARDETLFEYPLTSFNRLLYERFGMSFPLAPDLVELEFWKAVARFEAEPGVYEALDTIHDAGIPTGVVSNASFHEHVLWHELRELDMAQRIGFIMSSADYGCRKPHPALFLAAAGRLGLDPGQVWYIGDSLEHDVVGAQSVGMTAVWYNPGRYPASDVTPDVELRHWKGLAGLIDGARRDQAASQAPAGQNT